MTNGLSVIGYVLMAHDAYITCALWSSTCLDDQGDDVAMDQVYESDDIHPDSLLTMLRDVVDFVADNLDVIRETPDYLRSRFTESARSIGHDLWLTRNHHGAGFWDRGLGPAGQHLTNSGHEMGPCDLYICEDGRVHAS